MNKKVLWEWVLCTVLFVGSVSIFWLNSFSIAVDDAWITYRYAENLAAGRGFVYNPGEHILGTSTPLWTLILAFLAKFGVAIPTASIVLDVLFAAGTVVMIYLVGKQLGLWPPLAVIAALIVATDGIFSPWATSGMETPFYAFLAITAIWAYGRNRFLWAVILAGLAGLLRLDGLTVGAALLGVHLIFQRRLPPWRVMLIFVLMLLPWFVFSQLYFGSVFPNSMEAKQAIEKVEPWISRYFLWPYSPNQPVFDPHAIGREILAPLTILGLTLGMIAFFRGQRTLAVAATWVGLYLAAYEVARIPLFNWYVMAPIPVVTVLAVFGAQWLTLRVSQLHLTSIRVRILLGIGGVALVLVSVWNAVPHIQRQEQYFEETEGGDLVKAAEWLTANASSQYTIMTAAIGIIGYYTIPNRLIDTAGLVSRSDGSHLINDVPFHKPTYFIDNDSEGHLAEEGIWGDEIKNYILVFRKPRLKGFMKIFQRVEVPQFEGGVKFRVREMQDGVWTGNFVNGATAKLTDPSNSTVYATTTSANYRDEPGWVDFSRVTPGEYSILVYKLGMQAAWRQTSCEGAGETEDITVQSAMTEGNIAVRQEVSISDEIVWCKDVGLEAIPLPRPLW